jgi:transposase
MSQIELTGYQRELLQACLETAPSTGFFRRAVAVLALDEGQTVDEVAELLGVSRQSIYNWLQAYEQSPRPESLGDSCGGGRPSLWTKELQRRLRGGLRRRPDDLGYPGMNWTVPLLCAYLHDETGIRLSEDTVRRELQRLGYVWKRYRYVLPPDPEREKKTRHPPSPGPVAAAECRAGRGRNGPAPVPAAAGRLGVARQTGARADQRRQCQAGLVRYDQHPDRAPAVPGSSPAAQHGLPGIPGGDPRPLPRLAGDLVAG